jgi:hypothetical protein
MDTGLVTVMTEIDPKRRRGDRRGQPGWPAIGLSLMRRVGILR